MGGKLIGLQDRVVELGCMQGGLLQQLLKCSLPWITDQH
jgi:hypothetical protein